MKDYYVYIVSSETKTLYNWVTSDLQKRIFQHKNWETDWFTKRYNCNKLVYFESHSDVNEAIKREKQLKKWKRQWKNNLIEKDNPNWEDLYDLIIL